MSGQRITLAELSAGKGANKNLVNPGYCKYCGKQTTHHHYYCDKCYPQEIITIKQLTVENVELRHKIKDLERLVSANKMIQCMDCTNKNCIWSGTENQIMACEKNFISPKPWPHIKDDKTKMIMESQQTILGCSLFITGEWNDVARLEKALSTFELSELKKQEDARTKDANN